MAKRGQRLYRCDDCKDEAYHHWIELNRASRMHCMKCGCTRLELVSKEAKNELKERQSVRQAGHRDMTNPPR